MTSDVKTLLPSLIQHINSDLFTFENISSSITLETDNIDILGNNEQWNAVISYLPLKYFRIIDSIPGMVSIEDFDPDYKCNPKKCSYEKYGTTNMWRPLMILNNCPTIMNFNFKYIRYYNKEKFSNILSVLISRIQNE